MIVLGHCRYRPLFRLTMIWFLGVAAAEQDAIELKPALALRNASIRNVDFSPDNRHLAIPNLVTAGSVGVLRISVEREALELRTGFTPSDFVHMGHVYVHNESDTRDEGSRLTYIPLPALLSGYTVDFSPDGGRLAVAGGESVRIYEAGTWRSVYSIPLSRPVGRAMYSPDGGHMAVIDGNGVTIVRAEDGGVVRSIAAAPRRRIVDVAYCRSQPLFAACERAGGVFGGRTRVRVWNTTDWSERPALEIPYSRASGEQGGRCPLIGFLADGTRLVVRLERLVPRVAVIEIADGSVAHVFRGGSCLGLSRSGRYIAVGNSVYDANAVTKRLFTLGGAGVRAVAFSADDTEAVTVATDFIRRWRLP